MKTALILTLGALLGGGKLCGLPQDSVASEALEASPSRNASQVDLHQELYFAVLEGLYRDGVSTEDAKILVALDETSGHALHFVPGCPICLPATDAVRTYVARQPFQNKLHSDTFGAGLAAAESAGLRAPDLATRVAVIEVLMSRWMEQRMSLLRLTPAERSSWKSRLAEFRKKGMAYLQGDNLSSPLPLLELGRCALCDGANG